MAVVQTIRFNSKKDYYARYIKHLLNSIDLKSSVIFEEYLITVTIYEDSQEKLEEFSNLVAKYLPHSIYTKDVKTDVLDVKDLDSNVEPLEDLENITFQKIEKLLQDPVDTTSLEDERRSYSFESGEYLMVLDPTKLNDLFTLSEKEVEVLLSYEKPLLNVAIKDEDLKGKLEKSFVKVRVFDNDFSFSLAQKHKEKGYIFFDEKSPLEVFVNGERTLIKKDESFFEKRSEQALVDLALNDYSKDGKKCIAILNGNGFSFYLEDENGLRNVGRSLLFNSENIIQDLEKSSGKLAKNFKSKFEDIYTELESNPPKDLYGALFTILEERGETFEDLSNLSLELLGNSGVKVDTKVAKEGFDSTKLLASIISYKLADVGSSLIAYSFYESLGQFFRDSLNEMKEKYKVQDFILLGDFLFNPVSLTNIEKLDSTVKLSISERIPLTI